MLAIVLYGARVPDVRLSGAALLPSLSFFPVRGKADREQLDREAAGASDVTSGVTTETPEAPTAPTANA